MAAKGFNVIRIPALRTSGWSGVHYTYANAVIMNDCVMVPQFSNSAVSAYNAQAISIWQAACPNKTIVPINADAVVSSAGVLHCIMMHVPRASSVARPSAYLRAPNSGNFAAGDNIDISWSSDDDLEVESVNLDYSTDGGQSWTNIAIDLDQKGTYSFSAPATPSSVGQIRVTAFDTHGNSQVDVNDELLIFAGGSNSAALISYGNGKQGSNGVPSLDASGLPSLGSTIQIQITDALAHANAYLLFGDSKGSSTFDGGELLVNHSRFYPLTCNGAGFASLTGTVPTSAALIGKSYYWQAWIPNDPQASGNGWASTNGLQTMLGL
jgi:hypothetical protein